MPFLISNFRRVPHVVCFLLGNSPASEFCVPTFRNTLFHLHRQVGVERLNLGTVGVSIGRSFGSNIARANNKEGDGIGVGPFRTHSYSVTLLTIGSGYFRAKLSPVWVPQQFSNLVILHLPAYEDGTECSETSAYKIQAPGNYPEENIQHNAMSHSEKTQRICHLP